MRTPVGGSLYRNGSAPVADHKPLSGAPGASGALGFDIRLMNPMARFAYGRLAGRSMT